MTAELISLDQQLKMKPLFSLEKALLELPQVDMPVVHDFCDGLYARTLIIPAGVCLTGAIHRDASFFVVRSGVLVITDGESQVQVGPGFMASTPAHTKKAGIAVTDVVCTTFHPNPSGITDPDALWEMITIVPPESMLENKQ
jgi:hypothetical protein